MTVICAPTFATIWCTINIFIQSYVMLNGSSHNTWQLLPCFQYTGYFNFTVDACIGLISQKCLRVWLLVGSYIFHIFFSLLREVIFSLKSALFSQFEMYPTTFSFLILTANTATWVSANTSYWSDIRYSIYNLGHIFLTFCIHFFSIISPDGFTHLHQNCGIKIRNVMCRIDHIFSAVSHKCRHLQGMDQLDLIQMLSSQSVKVLKQLRESTVYQ